MSDDSPRLTLRQIAERWLAETTRRLIEVEALSVDLAALAAKRAFEFPVPKDQRPEPDRFPANYEVRTGRLIECFDRNGAPVNAGKIGNYLKTRRQRGNQYNGHVTIARDLSVSFEGLRRWWGTEEAKAWAHARNLSAPRFVLPASTADVTPPRLSQPDPYFSTFWNLAQVRAWIMLRDADWVRRCDEDFEISLEVRRLPTRRKERLVQIPHYPPSYVDLQREAVARFGIHAMSRAQADTALLSALQEQRLAAIGLRNGNGDPMTVPAEQWPYLEFPAPQVAAPRAASTGARPRELHRAGATSWLELWFPREDVMKLWPDPQAPNEPPKSEIGDRATEHGVAAKAISGPHPFRTGLPGRPKVRHLIEPEFQRRAANGEIASTLRQQAEQMIAWLGETYPSAPVPGTKSVENMIRDGYWRAKQTTPSSATGKATIPSPQN